MLREENKKEIIAEFLKSELNYYGVSSSEIATKLGRSRANISYIMNAKTSINPTLINKIIKCINGNSRFDYDEKMYIQSVDYLNSCFYEFVYKHERKNIEKLSQYIKDKSINIAKKKLNFV